MKVKITVVAIVFLALIGASYSVLRAQQDASTQRSVWDGVYTEEQAKRGQPLYNEHCASCHGDSLTGGEMAPPLVGGEFLSNWNGLTVGDLFERIRTTMPLSKPGKLSRDVNADITAYMLNFGQFPAGQTELPRDTQLLKQIKIEATKPEKKQ
jgi:S-disulfanyl-L-cysteine oxidoreductase SoxD